MFQTRGLLSKSTTVTDIESKQIGEGRGYANYTFLVKLTFSRPVNKDVPTAIAVKIANQTFLAGFLEGKPEFFWEFLNMFYICESYFYEDYRPNLTAACPKFYWGECEYPADPEHEVGSYGLMIEYMGDDLKMFTVADGIPVMELKQALSTCAKTHAGAWNDPYLVPIRDGGENPYILSAPTTAKFFTIFAEGGWAPFCKALSKDCGAQHPSLVTDVTWAYTNMESWFTKSMSGHGHRTLSSADLRSENLLWKKLPNGEFECNPIDHQAWWYGPPTRDILNLLLTSMQIDDMKDQLPLMLRHYYDALIAEGVDAATYSFVQFMQDAATGMWLVLIFSAGICQMVESMSKVVAELDPSDASYTETVTMRDNIIDLAYQFRTKALVGYNMYTDEMHAALDWMKTTV